MRKFIFLFIYTCLMGLSTQSFAKFSMNGLESFDDHQLANVVGQATSINNATDMYDQNQIQKIADFVASLTYPELQNGGMNKLSSLFYVNDRGQTVLQINQPIVSIGTIEATLSVSGLNDLGKNLVQAVNQE